MTFLYFVRHGEAETNEKGILSCTYDGYPLTKAGEEQVSKIARMLEGIDFSEIYSSPLLKCLLIWELLHKYS